MIFDDSAHDRKTQSGPATLGREIRQEQLLFYIRSDTMSGVGNDHFDRIATVGQFGGDHDLLEERIMQSFGSVIDEVRDRTLNGFRISLHHG